MFQFNLPLSHALSCRLQRRNQPTGQATADKKNQQPELICCGNSLQPEAVDQKDGDRCCTETSGKQPGRHATKPRRDDDGHQARQERPLKIKELNEDETPRQCQENNSP